MKSIVPAALAVGALVAWFAPRAPDLEEGKAGGQVLVASERQPDQAGKPAWYGGAMVLTRDGDGHFYADVRVDAHDYRMLVDTGASVVALTGEDARNIGLDWDPNALAPVVQGAGGPVLGVPVTIDNMAVGDFEAHGVQAVIIPEGLPVSLLGQSFLSRVGRVEISENQLTLTD